MKQRLTAIDIRALVMTLRRKIIGLRVANIYDISNKLYLFKLAAKGLKEFLLIEAGIRMHTTGFIKNKNNIPSGFSMKLRKHLRTRRVEEIRQVGIDRVVDITLGQGEAAYHILIEFYASGNLILTDSKYTILSLLRTHRYDEETRCAVGEIYPFSHAANLSLDSIVCDKQGIEKMLEESQEKEEKKDDKETEPQVAKKTKKKKKRKGEGSIKDTLIKMVPYMTPIMAEHCLIEVGIDLSDDLDIDDNVQVDKLIKAALLCKEIVRDIENLDMIPGYIIYDEAEELPEDQKDDLLANSNQTQPQPESKTHEVTTPQKEKQPELQIKPLENIKQEIKEQKERYLRARQEGEEDEDDGGLDPELIFKGKKVKEFICFQLHQMKDQLSLEFDWFDECVDLYFTQIDKQKEESKLQQKEAEIYKKMNRIKNDQLKRIEGLQKEQDNSLAKAKIMQKFIAESQAIIEILNALVQSGLQWKQIWRMIKEEKRSGNPLAIIINEINLEKNQATLLFNTADIKQEEESQEYFSDISDDLIVKIDLDLTLSAQANIEKYYEIKKKTQDKEERTKDKANEAIKNAEDQARKALLKTRNDQKLKTIVRKPFWFERFDWFISSENYLIISGKNAQQNEELVKTYLAKRDVYVHSEMAGAASCIIKNPSCEEIGPMTLNETGTWAICHSKAWDAKVVTNAFWVWGDQVSKTPESGEYLVTGSFMIRGKKNFVNPQRLELGCTILFKLDDDSVANHINERRNRLNMADGDSVLNSSTVENLKEEFEDVDTDPNQIEDIAQIEDDKDESEDEKDEDQELEEIPVEINDKENTVVQDSPIQEDIQLSNPEVSIPPTDETQPTSIAEESKEEINYQNEEEQFEEEEEEEEKIEQKEDKSKNERKDKKPKIQNNKKQDNIIDSKNKGNSKGKNTYEHEAQNAHKSKKNRMKKLKQKYGDQDDEDRKLMMELAGAKEIQKSQNKNKQQESNTKGDKKKEQKGQSKEQKKEQNKQNQKNQKSKKEQQQDKGEAKVEFKAEKQESTEKVAEDDKKEIEELMEEENIKILNENADISVLDKLTGIPKQNDTILFAVPMCAPYSVINSHKYKVKILPGVLKRGKARKLIQEIFGSIAKGFEIEHALLKAVPDDQLLEVLPKGCQVLAAGLNKLKQNKKKNKKAKQKAALTSEKE